MGCGERISPVLTRLMEARRVSADLRVSFSNAVDAANRAVMADTDAASIAFAHEAEQQTQVVRSELEQVDALLQGLGYSEEAELLKSFREAFAKYQTLDSEILTLAVENTNLKAQRLSFGPAHTAADAVRDALAAAGSRAAPKDQWHATALARQAVLAVREIEVLQAPHIAASEDAAMDELEKQMAAQEASARAALQELASLGGSALQPSVDSASAALSSFMTLNTQLVALSRRNSNVRSLALSLGQKRTLTAVCEGSLSALNARLAQRDFKATR
jgi:hypothetical protein